MYCIFCGKVIEDNSAFCGYCGKSILPSTPVSDSMVCPKCNATYSAEDTFCYTCGTKLVSKNQSSPLITPPPKKLENSFEFKVDNTFTVLGHGVVLMGTVLRGTVHKGDIVFSHSEACQVVLMEEKGNSITSAEENMEIGIYIKGSKTKIESGDIIIKPPAENKASNKAPQNKLLMQMSSSSIYKGKNAIEVAIFNGTLHIYADRIETKATPSATATVFVTMDEIESVAKSDYMVAWTAMILTLKDGRCFTITSNISGSATIDRAVKTLNSCINP